MLPDGSLVSHQVMPRAFIGAGRYPISDTQEYQDGPVAISNPYQGHAVQVWRMRYLKGQVWLTSLTQVEQPLFAVRNLQACSFTFDQNARPLVAYLVAGDLFLYWFDPNLGAYVHTLLDSQVDSVRIRLDDVRPEFIGNSDVILAYTQANTLYCRVQRDRYTVAYALQENIGGKLLQAGMNIHYRFQFLLQMSPYTDYSFTPGIQVL